MSPTQCQHTLLTLPYVAAYKSNQGKEYLKDIPYDLSSTFSGPYCVLYIMRSQLWWITLLPPCYYSFRQWKSRPSSLGESSHQTSNSFPKFPVYPHMSSVGSQITAVENKSVVFKIEIGTRFCIIISLWDNNIVQYVFNPVFLRSFQ